MSISSASSKDDHRSSEGALPSSSSGVPAGASPIPSALQLGARSIVLIEKLTHGGPGMTHIDGFPVFVPDTIPGQSVEITIVKFKGNYAEARLEKVIRRAKDEILPRCTHFHDCGGCAMQNLPYDKQLLYKEEILRETLEHLTPLPENERKLLPGRVLKIMPSPQLFHYRNKLEMTFGFASMRSETQGQRKIYFDENPTIGFHQPGQWQTVLPITECHLYDEQIGMLLQAVRRFMEETRLPVYNPKTQKGLLRTLLMRRGIHTDEQMLCFLVHGKKKELEPLFQQFMRHFGGRSNLKSLLVCEHLGLNDKPDHPKIHALIGKPFITERLFDLTFEISPFSFFQTNTLGTEKLYQAIADAADLSPKDTVLDVYCGMGTIGQYLARYCERVVGVESHPSAVDDALRSAGKNRISNISFYKGRAEDVLQDQLKPGGKYTFNCIIVDPPRAGLHPDVLKALLAHAPQKIVYVSCNTATLARDLGGLIKGGYDVRTVQPVDLFPHTVHIESVTLLQKRTPCT